MNKIFEFIRRVFTNSKFPDSSEDLQNAKNKNYNVKTLNNESGDRKVVLVDPGKTEN